MRLMECLTTKQIKDSQVLLNFIRVYCRAKHRNTGDPIVLIELPPELAKHFPRGLSLCPRCSELVTYSLDKRRKCPLTPKPSCKHCHIHCYSKEYRATIREIMAFSGRRMIIRGRLDYLWHYFF